MMEDMRELLTAHPEFKSKLFCRGFLLTDADIDEEAYPFYGLWNSYRVLNKTLLVHPEQHAFIQQTDTNTMILIGHAYNPFTMDSDENSILKNLLYAYTVNTENWTNRLNELTGLFVLIVFYHDMVKLYCDCAGMQIVYYGFANKNLYITSHMQLVGDLCNLSPKSYVQHLLKYRFYSIYGAYLPGDLSTYDELRRLVPNTFVTIFNSNIQIKRFYPTQPIPAIADEQQYHATIRKIGEILHNNLFLIPQKWKRPAISLTGGMDSKATLASANGLYEKFLYFSYASMPGEAIDADAAHKIAQAIGVSHQIDKISDIDSDFENIDVVRSIIYHNYGRIGNQNANDIRKRAYYQKHPYFDVEVKSWVSEIGRANYYKKFGFRKMPQSLSPRQMSTLYKFFLNDRRLLQQTDRIFAQYIKDVAFDQLSGIDSSDMFLWEVRYGSWGGQVITSEHKYSYDITIPYNNRNLIELLLSLPLEKRINDQVHQDLIACMNPLIDQTGITITNYNETSVRMWKEKLYYLVNTHIPW